MKRILMIAAAIVFSWILVTPSHASAQVASSHTLPLASGTPQPPPPASCKQPSKSDDLAHMSDQERAAKGYPKRVKGKDFSAIDNDIRLHGLHHCNEVVTSSTQPEGALHQYNEPFGPTGVPNACGGGNTSPCDSPDPAWAGNFADGDALSHYTGESYLEADFNMTANCPFPAGLNDSYSQWVGLGGVLSGDNLIQIGFEYNATGGVGTGHLWYENYPYQGAQYINTGISTLCGHFFMGQVEKPNYMYFLDITAHQAYGPYNVGPASSGKSAEFIAEKRNNEFFGDPYSDYGTITFLSCGVTINNPDAPYEGINETNHDYSNTYGYKQNGSHLIASTGPVFNVSGYTPPDTFTITWHNFQ